MLILIQKQSRSSGTRTKFHFLDRFSILDFSTGVLPPSPVSSFLPQAREFVNRRLRRGASETWG